MLRTLSPSSPTHLTIFKNTLHLYPNLIPIHIRLIPQLLLHLNNRIVKLRKSIQENLLRLIRNFKPQPQRTLHCNPTIAKIRIIKNLRSLTLPKLSMLAGQRLNNRTIQIAALIPQTAFHRLPSVPTIDQLDFTLALLSLAVRHHPNKRTYTSVIKHLLRQSHDRLKPIIFNNPTANITLTRTRTTRKQRRTIKHDRNP